jgi:hypothetical protein
MVNARNASPFRYDRMLSPFLFNDSVHLPAARDFRFGFEIYNDLLDLTVPSIDLDTNRGLSLIRVALGSRREQMLLLDHYQRIAKNFFGGIAYHSVVSPGFLLNSFALQRYFKLHLKLRKTWLNSSFLFDYGKVEADENGGIIPGQSVDGLTRSEFEGLQTFLRDDKRKLRRYRIQYFNEVPLLNFNKGDSLKHLNRISIHAGLNWTRWGTSYSGTADDIFYPVIYKDSSTTFDTSGFFRLQAIPALSYSIGSLTDTLRVEAGLQWNRISQRIDSIRSEFEFSALYADLNFIHQNLHAGFQLSKVISTVSFNQNDVSLFSLVEWKNKSVNWWQPGVRINFGYSKLSSPVTSLFYVSNHFTWTNDFTKETRIWIKPSLFFFNGRARIFADWYRFTDLILYDEKALPFQAEEDQSLVNAGISGDFLIRKFRVIAQVRYTSSSGKLIRVPEQSAFLRLSYRNRFFKKNTFAEVGTTVYGFSSYTANLFMPATSLFYLGADGDIPLHSNWDVFANVDFGKATITLLLQRLNNAFFGGESFVAPGYPAPSNTFKLVLNWKLFN